jgi:hypothetical protein
MALARDMAGIVELSFSCYRRSGFAEVGVFFVDDAPRRWNGGLAIVETPRKP